MYGQNFGARLSPFVLSRLRDKQVSALDLIDVLPPDLANDVVNSFDALRSSDPDRAVAQMESLRPQNTNADDIVQTVDNLKYGAFNNSTLSIGVASQLILPRPQGQGIRTFLIVVNTHATQNMFLAFGAQATLTLGLPIFANGGFFGMDVTCAQDDLYMIANGALTTGVLVYCNKSPGQSAAS